MIARLTRPPICITPSAPSTWLTLLVERYIRMLSAEDIPNPLGQQLTVGAVLSDLLSLAEAPTPAAIAELLGAPA